MDNEEARFLLSACQPSGRDADRPEIAEALAQAQRDPELTEWLRHERMSDAVISQRLRALEPPATLRARLLAGGRASRCARSWRTWRSNLGLAATIACAAAAGWWGHSRFFATPPTGRDDTRSALRDWQERCVGVFAHPSFQLDLESADYAALTSHLVAQNTPALATLPFGDPIVGAVGCKVLEWRGVGISLTCFRSDTGELVHLFVMPRDALGAGVLTHGAERSQVGAFAAVTWSQGEFAIMVASKLPANQLERTLKAGHVALATIRA